MGIDSNNFILILYFLAWIATFILYQRKKRQIDAGSILILSLVFYSLLSIFLYNNDNFGFSYRDIKLFPFVYLYSMLLISFSPILKYNTKKIQHIQHPTELLLNALIALFIISTIANIPMFIESIQSTILMVSDSSYGLERYNDMAYNASNIGKGGISNFSMVISNLLVNIGIFLTFYYMSRKDKKKYVLILLFVCSFIGIIHSMGSGERGAAFRLVATFLITYFMFKSFLSDEINRLIKILSIIFGLIITIPFLALSFSRFGESDMGLAASFLTYLGQQNLNFNTYGLDNNGIRYGDRTFPLFKLLLGFDNVPQNFMERRAKYPYLFINDEVFVSYVGDFTLDFGPIIAFFIFIIFNHYVLQRTKVIHNSIKFHQLILLHLVACICIQGGLSLYSFADIGGNLCLVVTLLIYMAFRLDYDINFRYKKR